jgi:hypothetical protein
MKAKRSLVRMTALLAFVLMGVGAVIPASAQQQATGVEFTFVNLTGGVIRDLVLSPAALVYEDGNVIGWQDLNVEDSAVFSVSLPGNFAEFDSFDIEVTLRGGRHYKTKNVIRVDVNKGTLVLELATTANIARLTDAGTRAANAGASAALGGMLAREVAKKAAKKIVGKVFVKIIGAAIPVIGPAVSVGMLLIEGIMIARDVGNTPDDLLVNVLYQ